MKGKLFLILMITAIIGTAVPVDIAKGDHTFARYPEARLSFNPKIGPAPLIVAFTNLSRYATKTKWTVWDVVIDDTQFNDTDPNIVYQYRFPGTFPVYLEAMNDAGNDIAVVYVTVLPSDIPSAGVVQFAGAPRAAAAGSTVNFINLTPQTGTKFLWDFGDGTSSTQEDTSRVYNTPGLYTVSLTVQFDTTLSFVSFTETKVNYINIFPAGSRTRLHPDFDATPVTGTAPQTVQFRAFSEGNETEILWDFGDGTTSPELNPKHTYNAPGLYSVKLKLNGEEVSKSDYINALPTTQDQRSPAAIILNGDSALLAILQNFSDTTLKESLAGLGLSELYKKYSLEISSILLMDEALRGEVANLVTELLPGFQSLLDGGTMTITAAQLEKIKSLLGRVSNQATPALGEFVTELLMDLSTGQFLKGMGIVVAPH